MVAALLAVSLNSLANESCDMAKERFIDAKQKPYLYSDVIFLTTYGIIEETKPFKFIIRSDAPEWCIKLRIDATVSDINYQKVQSRVVKDSHMRKARKRLFRDRTAQLKEFREGYDEWKKRTKS